MAYIRDEMIKPILIGGIVGGVLSSIPIIACLNCCCLLYVLSGVITAYLMSKEFDPSDNDYIIGGGLSGSIAGFIDWLLGMIISFAIFGMMSSFMVEYYPYPEEIHRKMIGTTGSSMLIKMLNLPISIILGAIFGAIGGILYEKFMK